jgi:hypothetical protein
MSQQFVYLSQENLMIFCGSMKCDLFEYREITEDDKNKIREFSDYKNFVFIENIPYLYSQVDGINLESFYGCFNKMLKIFFCNKFTVKYGVDKNFAEIFNEPIVEYINKKIYSMFPKLDKILQKRFIFDLPPVDEKTKEDRKNKYDFSIKNETYKYINIIDRTLMNFVYMIFLSNEKNIKMSKKYLDKFFVEDRHIYVCNIIEYLFEYCIEYILGKNLELEYCIDFDTMKIVENEPEIKENLFINYPLIDNDFFVSHKIKTENNVVKNISIENKILQIKSRQVSNFLKFQELFDIMTNYLFENFTEENFYITGSTTTKVLSILMSDLIPKNFTISDIDIAVQAENYSEFEEKVVAFLQKYIAKGYILNIEKIADYRIKAKITMNFIKHTIDFFITKNIISTLYNFHFAAARVFYNGQKVMLLPSAALCYNEEMICHDIRYYDSEEVLIEKMKTYSNLGCKFLVSSTEKKYLRQKIKGFGC